MKLKLKQPKILERDVKSSIRNYLRFNGWKVMNILQGMGCEKGISDLICIKSGQVVFCEIKTHVGNQSEHQKNFQADIEAHGGKYILARRLEDVYEIQPNRDMNQTRAEKADALIDLMREEKP
jgi:Holliday junction resolvase